MKYITRTEEFIAGMSGMLKYSDFNDNAKPEVDKLITEGKVKITDDGFVVHYWDIDVNPMKVKRKHELFEVI